MSAQKIEWNDQVKLILSDVDETVADLYTAAKPEMIEQLTSLLESGLAIFFITGQGLSSVQWRILDKIPQSLRSQILVGHCSGAEVIGHTDQGLLQEYPYYSVYEQQLNESQKQLWRQLIQTLITEFNLEVHPTMPVLDFADLSKGSPLAVMVEDRGPQITFEVVNGYDLSPEQEASLKVNVPLTHGHLDLRMPILERAEQIFQEANLPIVAKLGGEFAIDFVVKGVSKTTAVKYALETPEILQAIGLDRTTIEYPSSLEIWGDKFSIIRGGTDRHMCEAVSPQVRAIDFRPEDSAEFMPGYNIQVWTGAQKLHDGLLEYLQSRQK